MLTHKSKARKLTPGPSKKPTAAVEDSAPPRMKEKQTSPPWLSDLTRIAHENVDGLTQIVTENVPNKSYMLHTKRTGKEVVLNVNLACRHCLDLMFSGNYGEAVFEHENAHLVTQTREQKCVRAPCYMEWSTHTTYELSKRNARDSAALLTLTCCRLSRVVLSRILRRDRRLATERGTDTQ